MYPIAIEAMSRDRVSAKGMNPKITKGNDWNDREDIA